MVESLQTHYKSTGIITTPSVYLMGTSTKLLFVELG